MDQSQLIVETNALVKQLLEMELERRAAQETRLAAIEIQKMALEHRRDENLAQAKRARQQARTQNERLLAILQGQNDLLERIARRLEA